MGKWQVISVLVVGLMIAIFPRTPLLAQNPRDIPTNVITSVAWSPDGKQLATANNAGFIQLWDAETQTLERDLQTAQPNPILTVAWSPDGEYLAATVNENVLVWDTLMWSSPIVLSGHRFPIWDISWNPDSRQLASVSYGGANYRNFLVWDITLSQFLQYKETPGSLYSVDWSPDGAMLATTGGNRVELWDLSSQTYLAALTGQGGELVNVRWSPDGTQIASVGDDDRVVIWDATSGTMAHELRGHVLDIPDLIYSVAWSPDGELVASASSDGTVRVWHVESEQQIEVFEVEGGAYSVAWSPDGTQLAYGGENGALEIVNLNFVQNP